MKNKTKNNSISQRLGFTLIEIVIYCAIFVMFAVSVIESMIWISSKMSLQERLAEIRNNNVYKIYFANTYKRSKVDNQKIETEFKELISGTNEGLPSLKEDKEMGIILNDIESPATSSSMGSKKEGYKVMFFDSIDF